MHNSPKLEIALVSFRSRMEEHTVAYLHSGIPTGSRKQQTVDGAATCKNLNSIVLSEKSLPRKNTDSMKTI